MGKHLLDFVSNEEGQGATEYMLLISVVVIAVVGAAYAFIPSFQQGVNQLANDVNTILDIGCDDGEHGDMITCT